MLPSFVACDAFSHLVPHPSTIVLPNYYFNSMHAEVTKGGRCIHVLIPLPLHYLAGHSHRQYFIASTMKYPTVFHTRSDEILAVGTAWERGYCIIMFGLIPIIMVTAQLSHARSYCVSPYSHCVTLGVAYSHTLCHSRSDAVLEIAGGRL